MTEPPIRAIGAILAAFGLGLWLGWTLFERSRLEPDEYCEANPICCELCPCSRCPVE